MKKAKYAHEEDLDAVRALLEGLVDQGRGKEAVGMAVDFFQRLRDDNTDLYIRLMSALRERFGRKSEKISAAQLDLLFEQLTAPELPDDARPDGNIPKPPSNEPAAKPDSKHRGRQPLPANLRREPYNIPVPPAERSCVDCGGTKKTIGYVESEVLEFRPATFVVLVPRREKVACSKCEGNVAVADDDKIGSRMRPGGGLLADLIVGKWQDALPIERQTDRYKRLGVQLASSTLGDWAAFGVDMLAPIARQIAQRVLLSTYIQADDTTLKVLDPTRKPAVKRGHLWAFVGMEAKLTSFLYAPNWAAKHPGEFLSVFTGHLQGDGYAGFEKMLESRGSDPDSMMSSGRQLGCGMHIRRRFENAAKLGDARAAVAMSFFQKIYKIEAECKIDGLSYDQRLARRQSQSLPLITELYAWIDGIHQTLVPASKLYDATRYAIKQKERWVRCFSDGRFEIDNGEVERQLRRVALGRKNFLFAGSDRGAIRAAIAYTVLASCRMHDLDPYAYVSDVLRKIGDGWPQARINELLPNRWSPTLADAED